MQLSNEDHAILRDLLRRACDYAETDAERRRFADILARLSGLPPQLRDGFLYDYNDDQWRI